MAMHTPGPWTFSEEHRVVGTPDKMIRTATVSGNGYEQFRANGALIAAAPDMLAALKDMLRHFTKHQNDCTPDRWATLEAARATVAKAEGR